MKRAAFVVYLVALHGLVAVMLWRWPSPPSHVERMQAIHAYVDATVPDGAALFLGDSHTQRLAVAAVADRAVNFGISWQKSSDLRVPASVNRARVVYLLIGTNDVVTGRDPLPDLRRIASEIPGPLVWTGIPPIRGQAQPVNAAIEQLCREHPSCVYVEPPTDMLPDGVHFSPAGYADWVRRLQAHQPQAAPATPAR